MKSLLAALLRLIQRLALLSLDFELGPGWSRVYFVISCPIAQVQASSSITRLFVPFLLIDPLKKAFEALEQNYGLAYSDTGLQLSFCCSNLCSPWRAPQPVLRSLLTKSLFFSTGARWICGSFSLQASHCLQRSQQLHGLPDLSQQVR